VESILTTLLSDESQRFFIISLLVVVSLAIILPAIVSLSKIKSLKNQLFDIKNLHIQKDSEIDRLQREKRAIKTKNKILEDKLTNFNDLLIELKSKQTLLEQMQDRVMSFEESERKHISNFEEIERDLQDLRFRYKGLQKRNEFLVEENSQFRIDNKKILLKIKEYERDIFDKLITQNSNKQHKTIERVASEIVDRNQHIFDKINNNSLEGDLLPLADEVIKSQEDLIYQYEQVFSKDSDIRNKVVSNIEAYKSVDSEVDILFEKLNKKGLLKDLGREITKYIFDISNIDKKHLYNHKIDEDTKATSNYSKFTIQLPNDSNISVDSTLSLVPYETYRDKDNRIEREHALNSYLKSFEKQIDQLIENSKDDEYYLMVVPTREALTLALKHKSHLLNKASNKGIFLATPTILLMTLQNINILWQNYKYYTKATTLKIFSDDFYQKFSNLTQEITTISEELERIQDTLPIETNKAKESMR
jgi:DNA recombination protein RmuC